jgi:multiple sugar transport system substrate-binding protein
MPPKQIARRRLVASAAAYPLLAGAPARRAHAAARDIVYWHTFVAQQEMRTMQAIADKFANAHPDIRIRQEFIPNADYMTKVTAAVLAGSRPDVAMVTTDRFPDILNMGGLVDIAPRVNAWSRKPDFPADRWAPITAKGGIYGVPAFAFVGWCYYRKDWFDEAGISGPPRSFDEFLATAKRMTDPAKGRYGFGLRGADGGEEYVLDAIQAFGSPIVVDGRNAMDRARAIDGVRFWSELSTVHKVVPPSAPGDGFRQIIEGFKTGQTAMIWHHTGSLAELLRDMPHGVLMTAARPAGPAARIAHAEYQYNSLMSQTNEAAAWDWVSFWGEPDTAIYFLEATGYFPASAAAANDRRITGNPLYAAAVETFTFSRPSPAFPGVTGWAKNVVLPEFQKVLVGRSTPEASVDAMMKGLDAVLA